ncbi:MAG: hypothetical protein ACQEQD_10865 [Bacillota bacterium]
MRIKINYHKVASNFWGDKKVRSWDQDTTILALYLLTSPHKKTEGLFRLPKGYIAADLNWSLKVLEQPFNKLLEDGFIKYDKEVEVIYIVRALKYQTPQNPNQEKAAIKKLKTLPKTELLDEFIERAAKYNKGFAERLNKEFGKSQALTPTPSQTQNKIKNKTKKFSKKSIPFKASSFLIDKILENNSKTKVPEKSEDDKSMQKWCKDLDKLHRLGPIGAKKGENKGYSWKEIFKIIEWSQTNDFWKTNILSAYKLRKQVIKLENKMKLEKDKGNNRIDILKELYDDAQKRDKKEKGAVL